MNKQNIYSTDCSDSVQRTVLEWLVRSTGFSMVHNLREILSLSFTVTRYITHLQICFKRTEWSSIEATTTLSTLTFDINQVEHQVEYYWQMITLSSQELEWSDLEQYWLDRNELKTFWDRGSDDNLVNSVGLVMALGICM